MEIKFVLDEIQEHLNKDVEAILFNLEHPEANKHYQTLRAFMTAVARAYGEELDMKNHPQVKRLRRKQGEHAEALTPTEPLPTKTKQLPRPDLAQEERHIEEHVIEIKEEAPLKTKEKAFYESAIADVPHKKDKKTAESISIPLIVNATNGELIVRAEAHGEKYVVLEPLLQDDMYNVIEALLQRLQDSTGLVKDQKKLMKVIRKVCRGLDYDLKEQDLVTFKYYVMRDLLHMGIIEPLFHDKTIERVICEGINTPVAVIREGKKYATNIKFTNVEQMNALILKVSGEMYQNVNEETPFLDVVYRNFRVQANFGNDIVPPKFIMMRLA